MSQDVPTPTTPSYCTAADVAAILQRPAPSEHTGDGEPTLTQWNDVILSWEDHVDRLAKTSWRIRTVTEEYPFDGLAMMPDPEGFIMVPLRRQNVKVLLTASGDKVEVWNGSQFDDWMTSHTQGRQGDFYLVPERGQLFLRTRVLYGNAQQRVRLTYRYGLTAVPAAVKRATAFLAAADIATGTTMSIGGRGEGIDYVAADPRITRWQDRANILLTPFVAVEGL